MKEPKLPKHWGHMMIDGKCECKLDDLKKSKKEWISFAENEIAEWQSFLKDLKGGK